MFVLNENKKIWFWNLLIFKVWTGTYAVAKFKVLGFGPEEFKEKYAEPYGQLVADIQSKKEEEAKVQSE